MANQLWTQNEDGSYSCTQCGVAAFAPSGRAGLPTKCNCPAGARAAALDPRKSTPPGEKATRAPAGQSVDDLYPERDAAYWRSRLSEHVDRRIAQTVAGHEFTRAENEGDAETRKAIEAALKAAEALERERQVQRKEALVAQVKAPKTSRRAQRVSSKIQEAIDSAEGKVH